MQGWDCGERDTGRGLGENASKDVTVGKGMRGGDWEGKLLKRDSGERDAGMELWEKRC